MKNLIAIVFLVATLFFAAMGQAASATPTPEPAEETTVSEEATAAPAEETAAPAEETAAPAEETAMPEEEVAVSEPGGTLALTVRENTSQYKDVQAVEDAGYALAHGCISGPNGGAMGVHYVNGDLVGDGVVDATQPEAIIYEASYGQLRLVGVEYIVLAEAWDAANDGPPVLMGQVFNYNSAPNRYRLPAFYELHVWAWKFNPTGTFADWNPLVSCDEYTGEDMTGMGG